MEAPLIEENVGIARQSRAPKYPKHSQAITHGSRFQKAAALVDLAEDGVGLPEEILDHENFEAKAKLYFVYTNFDILWTLNYVALIILNFIETPLWCKKELTYTCKNRDFFYLGQLPYLSRSQSIIYEVVTFAVVFVHVLFPISYEGFQIFLKHTVNVLKVVCVVILFSDLIVFVIFGSLPFRISPYIRVFLFVLNFRQLRQCIVVVIGMLPTYLNILALLLLFLLFFSWVAYVIFENTTQSKLIFTSFGETVIQMLVLFTTSNNPDVWIPAYKASRWSILFFVIYILAGVYFVTNLILAVVYDSFKSQLVKQVSAMDKMRKTVLAKSFKLVDENNAGYLNKDQCIHLFEELNHYRSLPKVSREEYGLIFDSLDDIRDFQINLDEFYDLCNSIALKFPREEVQSCFETFPSVYNARFSKQLKEFIKGPVFVNIITALLLLNLVAVVIETTLDLSNNSSQKTWQLIEFIFGWIYVVEMLLKIYSYGFINYWRGGGNPFDFVITVVIVVGETMTFTSNIPFLSDGEWIRYLLICRILRLIRVLTNIGYKAFISTFLTLIPTLMPYLAVIFCVLCLYSSLGVQLLGGLVNAGNSVLEKTDIYASDYMDLNFNDFPSGMVTLFTLLVMNNWQVWLTSYAALTGTYWSDVFFISFYLISVLLLLNLVVAFVLEAFFAEMEMEFPNSNNRGRLESSKSHSQRVDILLHHILKEELNVNN